MQSLFEWLESLQVSAAFDQSGYFGAGINVAHLFALTVFLGATLVVDLRLLGRALNRQPLREVARNAQPWLIAGLVALLVTGVLQVLTTPMKAYYSTNFWFKMQLFAVALVFTFTLRQRIANADQAHVRAIWRTIVGLTSIALWSMIAVQGRLIGVLQ